MEGRCCNARCHNVWKTAELKKLALCSTVCHVQAWPEFLFPHCDNNSPTKATGGRGMGFILPWSSKGIQPLMAEKTGGEDMEVASACWLVIYVQIQEAELKGNCPAPGQ